MLKGLGEKLEEKAMVSFLNVLMLTRSKLNLKITNT